MWKPINDYEKLYSINEDGDVLSLKNNIKLKKFISGYGYYYVQLYKNNHKRGFQVSVLMARAFIEKIKGKNFVNHINGIKTDDRLDNLEWVTRSENLIHAYKTGLKKLKNKTSKYWGVYWNKREKKWLSKFTRNGKSYFFGRFDNEKDAHIAALDGLNNLS